MKSINACVHQNAAIDTDNNLWIWGADKMAMTPDGMYSFDTKQEVNYIPQKYMSDVDMVSCGALHTMCVTNDNRLWGWGDNSYGQLGLGDDRDRSEPTIIMEGVHSVFSNGYQTYAIKVDGTLWGWGDNEHGTILDSSEVCFRPVYMMDDIKSIASNGMFSMAIKRDDVMWGWGMNIGVIFTQEKYTFCLPVPLMEGVKSLSIPPLDYQNVCLIVTENGDLYSLGGDRPGTMVTNQLYKKEGHYPIKVLSGVADVCASHLFSLILLEDSRLFATGDNYLGQCGIGKDTSRRFYKPVFVMSDTIDMAGGHHHGMGLQKNGNLWIWGGAYGSSITLTQ